jgi:hypothetical protein
MHQASSLIPVSLICVVSSGPAAADPIVPPKPTFSPPTTVGRPLLYYSRSPPGIQIQHSNRHLSASLHYTRARTRRAPRSSESSPTPRSPSASTAFPSPQEQAYRSAHGKSLPSDVYSYCSDFDGISACATGVWTHGTPGSVRLRISSAENRTTYAAHHCPGSPLSSLSVAYPTTLSRWLSFSMASHNANP